MTYKEEKRTLRREIRRLKQAHTPQQLTEWSVSICRKLEQHPRFQQADTVLAYYSLPDEVQTIAFIDKWSKHKKIVLPVVKGDTLELRLYTGKNSLREGAFHILEPIGECFTDYASIQLAIIPGMAFDAEGKRLGRGKGYYDRLLAHLPQQIYKIGICYPFQFIESIPSEPHDITMNHVIH